jgi:hypothetical protein
MTSPKKKDGGSYDVGYGCPPRHTRFQKGNSGNKKGKLKGQKNLKTELLQELKTKVPVIEAGHKQLLSKQTIIVKRLVSDAAKGDPRAREQLLRLLGDIERTQPPQPANDPVGAAKDVEILARFKMELLRKLKNEDKGDSHD